ncbi:helix-turn-helix domain-containing protein [Reichenbachiella agarivorans]|uniref:Helix-turn-helix domain-containing protein n=1 Tax=Reichenbachiella agarivorans TaxID=2979464 RepID=A0ABY6CS86_9BACT|nr:helix-turn-helix domain-containing protein [Reichenbachiella agarivorans]UXP33382.1 helix-turn-helix domain-containing protein [Reichenbachiella agarivorans]
MYLEYKDKQLQSFLRLTDQIDLITENRVIKKGMNHLFWNQSDQTILLRVNGFPVSLLPNHITTATELQEVIVLFWQKGLITLSFNREFYCLRDHEEEVSCNGIIFYGTKEIPLIQLSEPETVKMQSLFLVFEEEFDTQDTVQGEMLQMLLTRMIIKCTRLAKEQLAMQPTSSGSSDLVRAYTLLVDKHFKTVKNVSAYADMLNKSPKTLANSFSQHSDKSPLRIIHERLIAEAKRILLKTDKTAKETAYELGFDDASAFNKLFKKISGLSPMEYKQMQKVQD